MPFASSSSRPRFLRREADSDEESETSSSGGEDDLEEDFPEEAQVEEDTTDEVAPGKRKKPPPITISLKRVCKVPYSCFLSPRFPFVSNRATKLVSGEPPTSIAPENPVFSAKRQIKPVYVIPDQVDCGLIRFHSRRVTCLEFHPTKSNILLSGDKARIWDARRLGTESCLTSLAHGRVVNSAYFSLLTGNKILTTSQDNRIRVWDSIFGNLESPSREIVHSHDFNRHLTPFRAEWDPKDPSESLVVIGRYISENYDGVALHPIDFIDTSTAQINSPCRTLLIWKARQEDWEAKKQPEKRPKQFIFRRNEKKANGKFDSDSGGDSDDDDSNGKKRKAKKRQGKYKKLVW
ncbi:hypothetical protein BHE74_00032139 [Ensete ventricosum]|nr:hypothetical protein BHE74_00032139 [Ensete ventricosum]RZR90281.1 hypothetical protein BHM03_00018134 [Ensete ventricosum]